MKTIKTIPFNLDTYKQNRDKYTVVTANGRAVKQLTKFDDIDTLKNPRNHNSLAGVVDNQLITWDLDGTYFNWNEGDTLDLMLQYEEEVRDNWVKVYKVKSSGRLIISEQSFNTKEEALKSCNRLIGAEQYGVINLNNVE